MDKLKVAKAFSKASLDYETLATLQKTVVGELVKNPITTLPSLGKNDIAIDIGSGTGYLSEELKSFYKDTCVYALDLAHAMSIISKKHATGSVNGDFENLPFKDNSTDLVTSSLAYQWAENIDNALSESYRILKPKGTIMFSTLTEGTLEELNISINKAKEITEFKHNLTLLQYMEKDKLHDAIEKAGFSKIAMKHSIIIKEYADMWMLLRSLKSIGAGSSIKNTGGGFTLKSLLKEANEIYCNNFSPEMDGSISATFEVSYYTAIK